MLGEKVEKDGKTKPGRPLQMMIDQKPYLSVNAESWESSKRNADPEQFQELKDNENKPRFLIKSLSSLNQQPFQTLRTYDRSACE